EIGEGAVMGRGDQAEIRLEGPFASSRHARLTRQGGIVVLEDLGSPNAPSLSEEILAGPQPLHAGDRVRIGDSEFTYVPACCAGSPSTPRAPAPAASAGATRTLTSRARRCSPSPTAWAARRPARS